MTTSPLRDEERYRFDVEGVLVRTDVLSPAELRRINEQVDSLGLPTPGGAIQSQRFSGLVEAGGLLRDLMDHPAVIDVVRELCGPQVRLDHAYGIVMSPGTSGLGLHGGGMPFDAAQYYTVHGGAIRTGLVAVQWALVDHPPGQGGFCCVPGSHKANFALPAGVGLDHELVAEVPLHAGDVVIFTEALTHGTLPWRSTRQRRTVLYKYAPGPTAWTDQPACRPDALGGLTDRQRRLCQPPSVAGHHPV
jgi:Phytanoyl-CoA dioxygenase (PhyH)